MCTNWSVNISHICQDSGCLNNTEIVAEAPSRVVFPHVHVSSPPMIQNQLYKRIRTFSFLVTFSYWGESRCSYDMEELKFFHGTHKTKVWLPVMAWCITCSSILQCLTIIYHPQIPNISDPNKYHFKQPQIKYSSRTTDEKGKLDHFDWLVC